MDMQQYEDQATVRLKFASMDGPRLVPDAVQEYEGFLAGLPGGWQIVEEGIVETIAEHSRRAKRLNNGKVDLVLVEHETGVEVLLITEGIKLAGTLVSAAVVGLASHLWAKWKQHRVRTLPDRQKSPWSVGADALILETNHYQPDGTIIQRRVIVGPSAVTDERLRQVMAEELASIM